MPIVPETELYATTIIALRADTARTGRRYSIQSQSSDFAEYRRAFLASPSR
jgi:hypothetical protein